MAKKRSKDSIEICPRDGRVKATGTAAIIIAFAIGIIIFVLLYFK